MDIDYRIIYPIGAAIGLTALAVLGIHNLQSSATREGSLAQPSEIPLAQETLYGTSAFPPLEQQFLPLRQRYMSDLLSGNMGMDELFASFSDATADGHSFGLATPRTSLLETSDSYRAEQNADQIVVTVPKISS